MPVPLLVAVCGLLFFLGHLLEGVFRRYRIPDVLPLILVGFVMGPLAGWVTVRGATAIEHVFTHIALIVILFHGGLELRFSDLRDSALPATRVAFGLMGLNITVVTLLSHAFGQDWATSILLGITLAPLAATVVIPMLVHLRLSLRVGTILTLESALGDVVAVVGVLTLSEALAGGTPAIGQAIGKFLSSLLGATILGLGAAMAWSLVLGRIQQVAKTSFATQAFLLVVAGLTDWLGYSGAIGALAFGIGLRNLDHLLPQPLTQRLNLQPQGLTDTETAVLGEAVFILKIFFFVYLGTLLRLNHLPTVGMALLLTAAMLVLRHLFFRLQPSLISDPPERHLAASMVSKGLATAVVAVVPLEMGLAGGSWIRDVAYAVIPLSILATALAIAFQRKQSVEEPPCP